MFVKAVEVILVKRRDKSEHVFKWLLFRSHQISLASSSETPAFLEAASGFIVTPNSPRRTCIFFSDSETRQLVQKHQAAAVARFWEIRRRNDYRVLDQRFLLEEGALLALLNDLSEEYRKDSTRVDAFSAIERICYWDAGQYDGEMRVLCAQPDKTFSSKWAIELSEYEAEQLRLNVLNILDNPLYAVAGQNPPQYFFVYVPYKDIK